MRRAAYRIITRRFRAGLIAAAVLVSLLVVEARSEVLDQDPMPNVLLIVTDDQRAGLNVMPHTHRLFVDQGTRFNNAYVTTPLCCPSRASMFTGQYAHNHGVRTVGMDPPVPETTIQYRLKQAGYRTGYVGKYFYGREHEDPPPYFDRWAVFHGYDGYLANVDGEVRRVHRYNAHFATEQAVRQLRDLSEQGTRGPWFMVVAPYAPHKPFIAEPRYEEARVPAWNEGPAVHLQDRSTKPEWVREHSLKPALGRRVRSSQLRTLMSVDDLVERLFEELDALGQQDTLAFFISDNGLFWAEHGLVGKRFPYQEAVRVPFMMRWPNRIPAGMTDERLVANIDIAPTILHAAGLSGRGEMDGRSLLENHARDRLLLEYWRAQARIPPPDWASTVTHTAQYIEYYDEMGRVLFREHYDLVVDPHQLVNVLGDEDPETDPTVEAQLLFSQRLLLDRLCRAATCP